MRSSVCCFLPQSSPCQAHLELSLHFLKGLSQSLSCQEHMAVYTIWLQTAGAAHVPSCLDSNKEGSCASPQALLGHPGALLEGEAGVTAHLATAGHWEVKPGRARPYKPSPLILSMQDGALGEGSGAQVNSWPYWSLFTLPFFFFFYICQFL